MDVLIAGSPGPLLHWVRDLVVAEAQRQQVPVDCGVVDEGDAWSPGDASDAASFRIMMSDLPGDALVDAARANRVRTVVVLHPPGQSLIALRSMGHEFVPALRHLSATFTILGQLTALPDTLVVTEGELQNPIRLAQRILNAEAFGQSSSDDSEGMAPPPVLVAEALTAEEAGLRDAILEPAFHYAASGERLPVIWPRACLYWGDQPGEPAPRVIDLSGPARVVAYGPYFHLPPGRWTARVTVAFARSCEGVDMAFELVGRAELGRRRFRVPGPGVFAISCPFTVPSEREALEVRLAVERGQIEGNLGIDQVALMPEIEPVQSVA